MTKKMSTLKARHGLGVIRTMAEFREFAQTLPELDPDQRKLLVDQAEILIRDLYVHLHLKRAMHAVEPVQRLRLLRNAIPDLTDREFHAELLDVFKDLRDLHTTYLLPDPYRGRIAFLGILMEQYFENGQPRWMVSKVADHLVTDSELKEGASISHWNGMPMDIAVWRNADKEAGSNLSARYARGLESMTLRSLTSSLTPDEDWVDLVYSTESGVHESRLRWHVFDHGFEILIGASDPDDLVDDILIPLRYQVGVDRRTEIVRRTKKLLFAPKAVREEERAAKYKGKVPRSTIALREANIIPTSRPDDLTARLVQTSSGTFGYLRLWTFLMKDGDHRAFRREVQRLLETEFPPEGLIIDVRGNGGGYIIAAEYLLQLLTHRHIEPEPAQFISTPWTLALTEDVFWMSPWKESLQRAIGTSAQYSDGIPLSSPQEANSIGQVYHGPIVLITDAFCYSACDMFAAGFQDHEIGTILGVDSTTGAGGANVLQHQGLVNDWAEGPLVSLPANAEMSVSLRRTLRVGARAGQVVEDLGVEPDVPTSMTRADLLEGNRDLLDRAGEILAAGTPRSLDIEVLGIQDQTAKIKVTTLNIPEVDVYVNGRPQGSSQTPDGETVLTAQLSGGADVVRLEGFEGGKPVGARLLEL